ncbi:MAG TPA: ATP-dependent protease subunit HslV [Armatimonadaceae bacterium]|nr:ATP-dependent protease subunit HslV [Armatimonadaceae bacterium]
MSSSNQMHATTIVAVRKDGQVAIGGDGQVTFNNTILKAGARKIRRMYNGRVVAGFAGSVADAQALADKFETKLEQSGGNLRRAVIEFAKEWRTDRVLRRLEAMMIVADADHLLLLSGDGNVIEPDDGVLAIGSGGPFALSAAKALVRATDLSARAVVQQAMAIAAEICVFTNDRLVLETIGDEAGEAGASPADVGTP